MVAKIGSFDHVFGKRAYDGEGKPLPWAEGSPDDMNAKYLRLRPNELNMHKDLMQTPIVHWPESLKELADFRQQRHGLCGDVLSVAVADWIRGHRVIVKPTVEVEPGHAGQ